MVERTRVTRERARTARVTRTQAQPTTSQPRFDRATQSKITAFENSIKEKQARVSELSRLENIAAQRAEAYRQQGIGTKQRQNQYAYLVNLRRKLTNRRQSAQQSIKTAIRDLERAKQGKTTTKQAANLARQALLKRQAANLKSVQESKRKVVTVADVNRIIKSKLERGETLKPKDIIPTGGIQLTESNIKAIRAAISVSDANAKAKQKAVATTNTALKKQIQAVSNIKERLKTKAAKQKVDTKVSKLEGLRQRLFGSIEQKAATVQRAKEAERQRAFIKSEQIQSKKRITIQKYDKLLSQGDLSLDVKSAYERGKLGARARAFTAQIFDDFFISFPRQVLGSLDTIVVGLEIAAAGRIDKTKATREMQVSKAAARDAVKMALKDPWTYALALIARPNLKRPVVAVTKVKVASKLPKLGSRITANKVFINTRSGVIRVSNSKGIVVSAGRIKNAKLLTTAKVNKAIALAKKLDASKKVLSKAKRDVLRARATPKQSKLVQAAEKAKLESLAEKFIKKQTKAFDVAKKYNAKQLQQFYKSLGFKTKAEYSKYLKASTKTQNKIILRNIKRLNKVQLEKLAKRKVVKPRPTLLDKGTVKAKAFISDNLAKLRKAKAKSKSAVAKKKQLRLDKNARSLGFKDYSEFQLWIRLKENARTSKVANLYLKTLEKNIAGRSIKAKAKIKKLKVAEARKLIAQAKEITVVLPKTRKLSKAKVKARQIRGRKTQPLSNFQFTINGKLVDPKKVLDLSAKPATTATTTTAKAATPTGLVSALKTTPKTLAKVKPRLRVVTTAKTLGVLNSRTRLFARLAAVSKSRFAVRRINGVKINLSQLPKLTPDTKIILDIIGATKPAVIDATTIIQKSAQKVAQATPAITELKTTRTIKTRRIKKKPLKTKKRIIPKLPPLKIKSKDFSGGHVAYVKQGKRWLRANKKPLTKAKAAALGRWVVDNSTSASYVVGQMKGRPLKTAIVPRVLSSTFRSPKRKSRLKPQVRIEKRKYRINTKGEKSGLKASRVIAKRQRKRRKR